MSKTIENLLRQPCLIIDILPERVPADRGGQYFAVEKYFRKESRLAAVKQKHIELVLKLSCYRDLSMDEGKTVNPPPEKLAEEMRRGHVCILAGGALILSEKDDTHLSVFGADGETEELIRKLAAGEGLYVWNA